MRFSELDDKMRSFEKACDMVLPEGFLVARLDGRSFTRLTKELCDFERPFDRKFTDMMVQTARNLMHCGFEVVYAYTQSDEISLLFAYGETAYDRRARKFNSVLAGEASAVLSALMGRKAVMDCRTFVLPGAEEVVDYFRWRMEDSRRNCLNAHLYWGLRAAGRTSGSATEIMHRRTGAQKRSMLGTLGVDYDTLPSWQRLGLGIYPREFEKESVNPVTGQPIVATRTELYCEEDLPYGEPYGEMVRGVALKTLEEYRRSPHRPRPVVEPEPQLPEQKQEAAQAQAPAPEREAQAPETAHEDPALVQYRESCAQEVERILASCAEKIVRRMNKEMKGGELMDEAYAVIGMNYTDQLSVKHQTLSYAEFEFGFEIRLDEQIEAQADELTQSQLLLFEGRDLPAVHTPAELRSIVLAQIKEAFGRNLDEHYNTARMKRFLETHPWI